jgi:pimeloyl-ACP methyl ester carboxylesterase
MAFRSGTVYFHGVPGSALELGAVGVHADALYVPDRNSDRPDLDHSAYFDHIAQTILNRFGGKRVTLIGFSLGAYVALEVAHRLGDRVGWIELISAAAPLRDGDVSMMAGGRLFRLARNAPWRFACVAKVQSVLARWWPTLLYRLLFATAVGHDVALVRSDHFQAVTAASLRDGLGQDSSGYRREIIGYVTDWSMKLGRIKAPVRLWHGTADNWTPYAMAESLAAQLPNVIALQRLNGASHYSTLQTALPAIAIERANRPEK